MWRCFARMDALIERSKNVLNRHARLANHARSAARRKDADILLNEALGQVQQSSLVKDGEDGNLLRARHYEALCFGGGLGDGSEESSPKIARLLFLRRFFFFGESLAG